ncbi:MAG: MmcQ/YjbR family DNA-binding protein [Deltaproteobacteria bacterium]|nr:MmcQ/YjbR family DNA-binding protein [Deltaproteobacteria bacterium]
MPRGKRGVDWAAVRRIALRLPGAEEDTSYDTAAFKVRKKLFARLRPEGEDLVLRMSFDDRERFVEGDPDVFHYTEHYGASEMALVRLTRVHEAQLAELLEHSWRRVAGKRLITELETRS